MPLQINSYLRAVAPLGRESEAVGPFTATCTERSDNPYLNYAIPDDGAVPTPSEVQALVAWFERRGRQPRLEYVVADAPAVEPVLLDVGFVVEGRLPLMIFAPDRPSTPGPEGVDLKVPVGDDEVAGLLAVTAAAFGSPAQPSDDDIARVRQSLSRGAGAMIACLSGSGSGSGEGAGMVVGGGTFPPIVDGLTEVAGIGVAATHRRRGIGQALARRLAEEALAAGAETAFLMAAHDAEAAIYARAGYRPAGEILHISREARGHGRQSTNVP